MRPIEEIKSNYRLVIINEGLDGFLALLNHPKHKLGKVSIIASWGMGWEHVSMAMQNRCPTWDEMCMLKDIFWQEDECVVQYHPPKSEYVNVHPYCLHLWKKIGQEFDIPPKYMIG